MNSFRSVERAIAFEIERQAAALDAGETLTQDTRGWNEDRGTTYVMRSKEDSHDYRYFPEPDLPPLRVDAAWLAAIRAALPELPAARRARYEADLGLSRLRRRRDRRRAARDRACSRRPARAAPDADPKAARELGDRRVPRPPEDRSRRRPPGSMPAELADLVRRVGAGELSGTNAKEVFAAHAADGSPVARDRRGAAASARSPTRRRSRAVVDEVDRREPEGGRRTTGPASPSSASSSAR